MAKYDDLLYPKAYRDIEEIYPDSHQERLTGRYAGRGYRQIIIVNYIAIFKIDEEQRKVFVVTVQYGARDI